MNEIFIEEGKLVSEKEWIKKIDSLTKKAPLVKTKEEAVALIKNRFEKAVEKRMGSINNFAIFFSGGVDSTLLAFYAKKLRKNFTCYSVGIEGSKDLEWSVKISKKLGFDLKFKIFSLDECEKVIKEATKLIGPNVVKVGVAAVVMAAYEISKKEKIFFSGLGSEELFAGYERHSLAKDINRECVEGLKSMWERDLVRDFTLAETLNFEVRTPFLDDELIKASVKIPGKYKISGEHKKAILREFAEEAGMPKEFAWRKKIAAQYGSGFDKAMEKLAKRNKFKTKREYLLKLYEA